MRNPNVLTGLRPVERLLGCLRSKNTLDGLRSKRRLTSQFGKIKNVKNFDVEKMVLLKIEFCRKL
jgi:hypothetical protein